MSDKELMEDIESVEEMVVDPDPEEEEETHDESATEEEVSEAKAAPEVDGAKAAEDDAAKIKASAPSKVTAPGGEANKGEPMPKTKAGIINAMYGKMNAMKKSDLMASYNKMMNAMAHGMKEDADVEDATPEILGSYMTGLKS